MFACNKSHFELVQMLLAMPGIDVNTQNKVRLIIRQLYSVTLLTQYDTRETKHDLIRMVGQPSCVLPLKATLRWLKCC